MNMNIHLLRTGILTATLTILVSCKQKNNTVAENATDKIQVENTPEIVLKDYGKAPIVLDIEAYTEGNDNFRTALWTGSNLQVTLMSIPVGGDIGLELHSDIDQFLRIEQGEGRVMMGNTQDKLDFVQEVKADHAIFIPAGKWHNLVNTGNTAIKLYSIYAPIEHPHGTVHKTQTEAIEAEHHH